MYHQRNVDDRFPEGCPCKLRIQDIIHKIEENKLNYVMIPLNNRVNKCLEYFNKNGLKYRLYPVKKPE